MWWSQDLKSAKPKTLTRIYWQINGYPPIIFAALMYSIMSFQNLVKFSQTKQRKPIWKTCIQSSQEYMEWSFFLYLRAATKEKLSRILRKVLNDHIGI